MRPDEGTCPFGHRAKRVHEEIAGGVEDCLACTECKEFYVMVGGRWFEAPEPARKAVRK